MEVDDEYMTISEVCRLFKIRPRTLHMWRTRGKITPIVFGVRTVRFTRAEVERCLGMTIREARAREVGDHA